MTDPAKIRQKPRVVLIGDTSLGSPHFGCQLVGQTFREQLVRSGLQLIASLPYDFERFSRSAQLLKSADLVIINGEGSIHHGRFHSLVQLASHYPAALVNSVYQENPVWPELKEFRYISTRESLSAGEIRAQKIKCDVIPDVLFASALLNSFIANPPRKTLGITDNARKTSYRFGPVKLRLRIGLSPKQKLVSEYLDFLCDHQQLCIGRFHAAIAASVLGIPFSTWDSNTWKMKGLMHDMGMAHLHFATRQEAIDAVPAIFDPRISAFAADARQRIEAMFDTLARIAANNAEGRLR